MRCIECGWTGEGGAIEYSNNKLYHFRANIQRGKIAPILCCGEVVEDDEARLIAGGTEAHAEAGENESFKSALKEYCNKHKPRAKWRGKIERIANDR